jgi:VWFA-related protein
MMLPGISGRVAVASALAFALAAAPAPPQRPPIVLLDVAVESAGGHVVTGLTRDDFEIVTGGDTRPIESFAAGKDQPLSLVLLFDVTSSMEAVVKRSVVRSGVEKWFVDRLAPQDRVQVGTFAKQISIAPPISGNPRALLGAVRKALDPREADTLGPSPIWDAVDNAVTALAHAPGRRAVLLVTDGRGTGNRLGPEDAGRRAAAEGVAVSVVGEDWEMTLRQDGRTGVRVMPGVALEWITSTTGGLYLRDRSNPAEPGQLLERLLADIHERYTLGFTPPMQDGKTHILDVRVNRPGLKLRSRRTFVAPAEASR